jgi:hypothetical protein
MALSWWESLQRGLCHRQPALLCGGDDYRRLPQQWVNWRLSLHPVHISDKTCYTASAHRLGNSGGCEGANPTAGA